MTSTTSRPTALPKTQLLLLAVVALVVGLLAVSGESYWIDETSTLTKAMQPTLGGWWHELRAEGTSNMQLPLYLLYAWAWEKPFGAGEWAMRAANVPWFVLGLVALAWALPGGSRSKWIGSFVALFSAFAWYYVNEARPYGMQLGASCFVFAALIQLAPGRSPSPASSEALVWGLVAGSFVLAGSGMLGMIWLGGALLAAGIAYGWNWTLHLLRQHWLTWTAAFVAFGALGGYYLWTMTLGARATNVAATDWKSMLFLPYEMYGFAGLGPSRLDIRSEGFRVFKAFIPGLAIYGALTAWVGWTGWQRIRRELPARTGWAIAVGMGGVALFLIAVGMTSKFRVLGRHFTPVWPILIYPLALGLVALWENGSKSGRIVASGWIVLSLISCQQIRFGARHARDDYRGAAAIARAALQKGEQVWWCAADQAATVYQVPWSEQEAPGKALLVELRKPGFEAGLRPPDLIVLSKPETYDRHGGLAAFMTKAAYQPAGRLQAFTLWRRKP